MKKCFKCCKVKPLSEFYKHKEMVTGHVNKCKECNKLDVRRNRKSKLDYYREYDKRRGNRQGYEYVERYREENPKKYSAHQKVAQAVKSGALEPKPCEVCGEPHVHGHHDDYDEPLNVRWLCPAHHKMWHDENGEGLNAH